jgi:hypothetical protein
VIRDGAEDAYRTLIYTVRASDYRGARDVEIALIDARPSAHGFAEHVAPPRAAIEVRDYRKETRPHAILEELRRTGELAVWREGPTAADIPGHDRTTLPPADALAIWTAPPGPAELRAALERVSPIRVHIFGLDPDLDRPEPFMRRLAGQVRYALGALGARKTLSSLAATTAQREVTVLAGLEWLAARGDIRFEPDAEGLVLSEGPGRAGQEPLREAEAARAMARVEAYLAETAAYRAFFRSTAPNDLLRRS